KMRFPQSGGLHLLGNRLRTAKLGTWTSKGGSGPRSGWATSRAPRDTAMVGIPWHSFQSHSSSALQACDAPGDPLGSLLVRFAAPTDAYRVLRYTCPVGYTRSPR